MSELPEHIAHNLATLQENLIHYNPVVSRLIQLAEQLGFGDWPSSADGRLAVPGGLVIHSVETAMAMMKLHRAVDPRMMRLGPYAVMLVGLFHDVGKCGVEKYPHWEEVPDKRDGRSGDSMRWQETRLAKSQGHGALGISLFERAGVPLSTDEGDAVRDHGFGDEGRKPGELGMLLRFANTWTNASYEERAE